jgi:hypothetical protein
MKRRLRTIVMGLVAVAAGCSSHHAATPASTTTSLPPPTAPPAPTTTAPNPDVIPPVITASYVDSVFAVLNHIDGNAARSLVASHQLTPEALADLRAIYNDPLYRVEVLVAEQGLADLSNVKVPPGDRVTIVNTIKSATRSCIFVETTSSLAAVELHPTGRAVAEYWELQPKQPGEDPGNLNPTPWALSFNQDYEVAPQAITDPCLGG